MMSLPSAQTLQLVFVDMLFLCLAASLLLWFRSWLKSQNAQIDRRLETLEEHELTLERLATKLAAACRQIEARSDRSSQHHEATMDQQMGERPRRVVAAAESAATVTAPGAAWVERLSELRRAADETTTGEVPSESVPQGTGRRRTPVAGSMNRGKREEYGWARQLLEQGMSSTEVARKVGLGLAEVEVLKRINEYGDYSR